MNRSYGTLIGVLFFSLSGCGTSFANSGFTCLHADEGHIGPDGMPDPCHYQDCPACATASPYADLDICLLSCPYSQDGYSTCRNPDDYHIDTDNNLDPCHYKDCPYCAAFRPFADVKTCLPLCEDGGEDAGVP